MKIFSKEIQSTEQLEEDSLYNRLMNSTDDSAFTDQEITSVMDGNTTEDYEEVFIPSPPSTPIKQDDIDMWLGKKSLGDKVNGT